VYQVTFRTSPSVTPLPGWLHFRICTLAGCASFFLLLDLAILTLLDLAILTPDPAL
jgi:hypothetical protein